MNFLRRLISPLVGASHAPAPISETEFTEAFAHILREKMPDAEITIGGPLELKLRRKGGNDESAFLENAFTEYQANPALREEVLEKFATAFCETARINYDKIDRARIVPVIKDAGYLREVRQALKARGHDTQRISQACELYNSELVILYAEDSPRNVRYLTEKEVRELGLQMAELRAMAIENLRRLLPDVQLTGDQGLYMMSAGGDYEASLLLVDSIWNSGQIKVAGDIVVAIPARGLLVITGSQNKSGLKKLREVAAKTAVEAAYRLTPKLFVYRNSRFEVFDD